MKVKESDEFTKAYQSLNPEQRQAVDTIEGAVMVVAGPGTGKTQILTLRIANILRLTDTEPENILALTFTEAAAANMRKRLTRLIGSDGYQVQITTFHSFANDIIQSNPDEFPAIIGARPMTELDQIQIIQDIILETSLGCLKPFGDTFFYVRPVLSAINNLKREGVTPERFADIVAHEEKSFEMNEDVYHIKGVHIGKMKGKYQLVQKKIEKNKELLILYKKYQERIRANKRYDFTDMIMEVVRTLEENNDLLLRLQETHQYILVDEHQDTNNAQNRLLELLAHFHENPNLFVVGDEKQSIFRFQGANLENFSYFKHIYPHAVLITLERNYRSPQGVLDSAHSLIAGPVALQSQIPKSTADSKKPIEVVCFPDIDSEIHGVIERIHILRKEGVPLEEIAILYRNNRDAVPLLQGLQKSGIPHLVESNNDIFSDPLTNTCITLIRAIADFGNDLALARALHLEIVDASPLDVVTVVRAASHKKKYSLYDCLKNRTEHLSDCVLYKPEALDSFFKNLEHWVQLSFNQDLVTVVEAIIRESGLLQSVIGGTDPEQGMSTLNTFFDQVRQLIITNPEAHLRDLLSSLDMMREHGIAIEKNMPSGTPGYVRLMTAHRSKGLEFEYVIIVHVYNGNWGNKMRRETLPLLDGVFQLHSTLNEDRIGGKVMANGSDEEEIDSSLDDERRLFYVALTRAKKHILITVPQHGRDGRELIPSQFLQEIDQSLLVWNTDETRKAFLDDYEQDAKEFGEVQSSVRGQMQEFVRSSFLKQGLSVSALNNYLQSPWQYFFRNLVRIPSVPDKFQAYGIAVHAALNDLFETLKEGEEVSEQFLLDRFDIHLESQTWSQTTEYQDTQDKGYRALSAWYQEYHTSFSRHTFNEFRIHGVQLTPDIRLTGVLDKVEFIDGSDRYVHVVDYKTGKPKSRKQLMGETKDADGNYYRQLVFYKLLLKYFKDGRYVMASGEIDFIEPDDKGKLHKEKFIIADEEVTELEETIKRVSDEIMSLSFWDMPCDPETCEYCDLVPYLQSKKSEK